MQVAVLRVASCELREKSGSASANDAPSPPINPPCCVWLLDARVGAKIPTPSTTPLVVCGTLDVTGRSQAPSRKFGKQPAEACGSVPLFTALAWVPMRVVLDASCELRRRNEVCVSASCELRVASCESWVGDSVIVIASCELRVASCESWVGDSIIVIASCVLRVASCGPVCGE